MSDVNKPSSMEHKLKHSTVGGQHHSSSLEIDLFTEQHGFSTSQFVLSFNSYSSTCCTVFFLSHYIELLQVVETLCSKQHITWFSNRCIIWTMLLLPPPALLYFSIEHSLSDKLNSLKQLLTNHKRVNGIFHPHTNISPVSMELHQASHATPV